MKHLRFHHIGAHPRRTTIVHVSSPNQSLHFVRKHKDFEMVMRCEPPLTGKAVPICIKHQLVKRSQLKSPVLEVEQYFRHDKHAIEYIEINHRIIWTIKLIHDST